MACPVDSKKPAIRVRRDTLVTVEDGRTPPESPHPPSPFTTVIKSEQAPSPPPQRTRPKSFPGLSGSSNRLNDMLRSDSSRRIRPKTNERDTAKDLIDFFRNTSPPPGNYMSTPDTPHEKPEKSHKRFRSWPFRKRSKHREESKGAPGLIKLPDSAVVGRTIGGHRHIAISIPIEHAHLEPVEVVRNPTVPPAEPPSKGLGEEQAEDNSEPDSLAARRTSSVSPVMNGLPAPPWHPGNDPAGSLGAGTQLEKAEPPHSQTTDTSVGAHSMIAAFPPELTVLPQDSVVTNESVANALPGPRQPLRHQATFSSRSADSESIPDTWARRSLDPSLLRRRPSTPDSFYTSSSEPICSDTTTVRIPSLDWGAESSYPSGTTDSDADDSFHTAELAQSPLTTSSRRTASMGDRTANSSPAFNFSTANNGSTSGTSSMDDVNQPHYTQEDYHTYQPHTLSDITSLESLLPSEMSETFHIAPVMTVVDIQPSTPPLPPASPAASPPGQAERYPRYMHGISDVRSTVAYYESLPQRQQPQDSTQTQPRESEPREPEPDYEGTMAALEANVNDLQHTISAQREHVGCLQSTSTAPRSNFTSLTEHQVNNPHRHPEESTETQTQLRVETHPHTSEHKPSPGEPEPKPPSSPHPPSRISPNPEPKPEPDQDQNQNQDPYPEEINIPALTARLDRNEHQLHTLLQLTERLSRQFASLNPTLSPHTPRPLPLPPPPHSLSTTTSSSSGSGALHLTRTRARSLMRVRHRRRRWEDGSVGGGGGGGGGGEDALGSPRHSPPLPLVRVESASSGSAGMDSSHSGRGRRGDLKGYDGMVGDMKNESWLRSSSGSRVVGGDINEASWLRSDSGSRDVLSLGLGDGVGEEVVDGPGRGHGMVTKRDGLRPRSTPAESLRGDWRARFAGRQAAASAWERHRREVDGSLGLGDEHGVVENAAEDPAGLDTVESVMRELVLGRSRPEESRGADTR